MRAIRSLVLVAMLVGTIAGPLQGCVPEKDIPIRPRVLGQTPRPGQELGLAAPLVIRFNEAMDEASVKKALLIDPPIEGQVTVKGDQATFAPAGTGFKRATRYRVTVRTAAKSTRGVALGEEVVLRFDTVGYLMVAEVQPAPGVVGVDRHGSIVVVFNRPVVALTDLQAHAQLPQPVVIEPEVKGTGQWLNTAIYQFTPADGFAGSTRYTATVGAGLVDTVGSILQESYTWSFTTNLPSMVSLLPRGEQVAPTAVISATFNQPMDPGSIEALFRLSETGNEQPVAGALAVAGDVVTFAPSKPLTLGARYRILFGKGTRSVGGGELGADYETTFGVVGAPKVAGTTPAAGDRNVSPSSGVQIQFVGPMLLETITPTLRVEPIPKELHYYYDSSHERLYLSFSLAPATEYKIVVPGTASDPYGNTLGSDYELVFRTRDLDPMAYLQSAGYEVLTFDADMPALTNVSVRNVSRMDLKLYSMGLDDFLRYSGDDNRFPGSYQPGADQLLRQWSLPVTTPWNAVTVLAVPVEVSEGRLLEPGAYYLELTSPEQTMVSSSNRNMMAFLVTRTNLTLKVSGTQALVWATDLQSGRALSGQRVALFDYLRKPLAMGTTDSDGLLSVDLPVSETPGRNVFAVISEGDGFGVVGTRWTSGIQPYEFSISPETSRSAYVGYLYTERPIYRPTQKVYYRGVIRADDDAAFSIPQSITMSVTIRDSQMRTVASQEAMLSEMGTFDGELQLGADAALGTYSIMALMSTTASRTERLAFNVQFQVAEYRKPEFEITVATDKREYTQGDRAEATVAVRYYSGGPLAGGKTRWTVTARSYSFLWTGQGGYAFAGSDGTSSASQSRQQVLADGEGVTDAQGRLQLTIPADISTYAQSQVLTLEATTTDINNQQVTGRTEFVVHKGLFYIGLRPETFVSRTGRSTAVSVITVDSQSAPVPQVPVTVAFVQRKWTNAQARADNGQYYWTSNYVDTPVFTQTVTTDANGQATAQFAPPTGGSYRILATARDSRGNEIRSARQIWVSGSSGEYVYWQQENHNRITLVADKSSYVPGETAHVLVPSPFQGDALALVTVERGHILTHQVIPLPGNSAQMDVPIGPDYAPNVFVSVMIVKGQDDTNPRGAFRLGYVKLDVSTVEQELTIRLTPDRTGNYGPRDNVTFAVETLDHAGQGVPAELSLALVDLSVLALAGAPENAIRSRFFGSRGLGVRTASSTAMQQEAIAKADYGLGKGGGGGGEDYSVRTEFPDTAYWDAEFRTDASGKGQVTMRLPDSLTTWRLSAVGVTADTLMGVKTVDLIATKDLLVRTIAPRFFVIGDQAGLSAIVHNNTDQALRATVSFSAEGLTVDGGSQTVNVPAHGLTKVSWTATALAAEQAVLTFSADAGTLQDALQLTLPVYHFTTPEVLATVGEVGGGQQRMEKVTLPEIYDPSLGDLRVEVDPSLAAGALEGLSYLEHYPYECVEQTVSRFLPNVVTLRALRELGVRDTELEAKLPELVSVGLQRLYARQHLDGGWGWWADDASSPFISAYVLLALGEAERAGLAVDAAVVLRGAEYLKRAQSVANLTEASEANRQAFVAFVLVQLGQGDNGRAVSLFDQHEKLDYYGRAFLALALKGLGSEHASRIETLVSELVGDARLTATTTHWEEATPDWLNMGTDVRTTAIALRALVALDPENALLAGTVRWLMNARVEGRWGTTQDNAWALMALTDYMTMTGELAGQYRFQVGLNGKRVLGDTVSPDNVREPRVVSIPIRDLLADGSNSVLFDRAAIQKNMPDQGMLYYSMDLRTYLPVERIEAVDNGLIVSRQYTLADRPDAPIHEARVNDTILVTVTLSAPASLHYLVLEDPIPAGTEAIDTSLKTTSSSARTPTMQSSGKGGGASPSWYGYRHFGHSELRDDKVALFANYLPRGTYEYSYLIRASVPGKYLVMPTLAYPMYAPEIFGRSKGETFTIAE